MLLFLYLQPIYSHLEYTVHAPNKGNKKVCTLWYGEVYSKESCSFMEGVSSVSNIKYTKYNFFNSEEKARNGRQACAAEHTSVISPAPLHHLKAAH